MTNSNAPGPRPGLSAAFVPMRAAEGVTIDVIGVYTSLPDTPWLTLERLPGMICVTMPPHMADHVAHVITASPTSGVPGAHGAVAHALSLAAIRLGHDCQIPGNPHAEPSDETASHHDPHTDGYWPLLPGDDIRIDIAQVPADRGPGWVVVTLPDHTADTWSHFIELHHETATVLCPSSAVGGEASLQLAVSLRLAAQVRGAHCDQCLSAPPLIDLVRLHSRELTKTADSDRDAWMSIQEFIAFATKVRLFEPPQKAFQL